MKRVRTVMKSITKVLTCPVILWPLMVVIFLKCMFMVGVGEMGDFARFMLSIECMKAPEQTAYVDILVKMNREDPNYVDFTEPPKRFVREYIDENGISRDEYVNLSITGGSEIAKWNEEGYVSLTLHHKDVKELQIWEGYERDDGSYISPNEELEVEGYFLEDFYKKYGKVRVAYVDDEGNVLKVTDKSKKKYIGWKADRLIVNEDTVVYQIGEPAPWMTVLFYVLALAIPVYTIWLIIKILKLLLTN